MLSLSLLKPNPLDYREFSLLRSKYKLMSKNCYKKFIERTESQLCANPKVFWKFLKRNKSSNDIPKTVLFNDKLALMIKKSLIYLLSSLVLFTLNTVLIIIQLSHIYFMIYLLLNQVYLNCAVTSQLVLMDFLVNFCMC